ncbi:histidine kinase/DNA gyrase B/HSP90-like ATPase [Nocardiopsis sp. Huas11]|uniref:sensor histidine kinase n=1 Tax=Nocardiopsis sp. Huas11 TaxID=2183912 RepID=UPI000F12BA2A|nr:histidine kinase [Nocardiopsis sp. Huas11]RKS10599.1 histidine kinase/DNA gyrase B/HSP90-like ATPase [Nocardiopsis sp. Huas11]
MDAPERHWAALDPRGGATRRRLAADAVLALAHAGVFGWPALLRAGAGPEQWAAAALLGVVAAGILLRWRWPAAAFGAVLAASVVLTAAGWGTDHLTAAAWTLYPLALTARSGTARPHHALFLVIAVLFAASVGGSLPPGSVEPVRTAVVGTALLGTAWLLGRSVHERGRQEERALAAAAQTARTRERLRLAREVHDVVSHTLGAVGMRAGVARYAAEDPDALRAALADIETTTRAASDELRGLLRGLRADGSAPLEPEPGMDGLADLVETARSTGLTCRLTVEGADAVPPNTAVSVHRLVREALTNAVRHAPGTTCAVTVTADAAAVAVEVTDTGPAPGRSPSPGSGTGLAGMRERVAAHGGTLEAGPRPGGGYRVHARLPYGARTDPPRRRPSR